MAIDKADFARDCVNQGLFLGVNAHFLLAVADFLSGIKDDTVDGKIGPFRITQADWDKQLQLADPNLDGLQATDINSPGMQSLFAAVQALNAQDKLVKSLKRFPSANELYGGWPKAPPLPGGTLQDALDNTRALILPAVNAALAGMDDGDVVNGVNLQAISPAVRRGFAQMIVTAFDSAGFGKVQQVAAVANAIAESNLNPSAVNDTPPENSVGLFQLNINGGIGAGHTVAELKDPAKNINLIIAKAKTIPEFKTVTDLHDAVAIFVQKIEQPANQAGEIIKRLSIALQIKA